MPTFLSRAVLIAVSTLTIVAAAQAQTQATAQPATPPAAAPGALLQQIEVNFARWDADGDGTLTMVEIELAVTDPATRVEAATAVAVLRNRAALRDRTMAGYRTLTTTLEAGDAVNTHEQAYETARKKLADTGRAVFARDLPGTQLAQGKLGDCFLLAGVGTMAQTNPQRLHGLVEALPEGRIAVNFGDGQRVALPAPTDAEVIIGSTTRGDGVWGNVFEKAIGQRLLERQREGGRHRTPYGIIGVGGTPHVPLMMLTGHKVKREGCEMFQRPGLDDTGKAARLDAIRTALESALRERRVIVGGTAPLSGSGVKVKGLYYNHSYGVLHYDRATDVVTFWNPMSNGFTPKGPAGLENGYPTRFGRFDCPLTEAVMWFGSFSIEQNEPVDPAPPPAAR